MDNNKNKVMLALDKNFMMIFIGFVFGFLLSFFICWNTIIYVVAMFKQVNGLM